MPLRDQAHEETKTSFRSFRLCHCASFSKDTNAQTKNLPHSTDCQVLCPTFWRILPSDLPTNNGHHHRQDCASSKECVSWPGCVHTRQSSASPLWRWSRRTGCPSAERLLRLEWRVLDAEVRRLTLEKDLLKKAAASSTSRPTQTPLLDSQAKRALIALASGLRRRSTHRACTSTACSPMCTSHLSRHLARLCCLHRFARSRKAGGERLDACLACDR